VAEGGEQGENPTKIPNVQNIISFTTIKILLYTIKYIGIKKNF
jgi:hypothetical protein